MPNEKIELYSNDGSKWDNKRMCFMAEWSFVLDTKGQNITIYAAGNNSDCDIDFVTQQEDGCVAIHLKAIPMRIDKTDRGNVWLLDYKAAKQYPEPYKTLPKYNSQTIYLNPNYELVGMLND